MDEHRRSRSLLLGGVRWLGQAAQQSTIQAQLATARTQVLGLLRCSSASALAARRASGCEIDCLSASFHRLLANCPGKEFADPRQEHLAPRNFDRRPERRCLQGGQSTSAGLIGAWKTLSVAPALVLARPRTNRWFTLSAAALVGHDRGLLCRRRRLFSERDVVFVPGSVRRREGEVADASSCLATEARGVRGAVLGGDGRSAGLHQSGRSARLAGQQTSAQPLSLLRGLPSHDAGR
mmetsp:Transcript_34534/g.86753  ORF Transcript_34534/g.86753 Transcript_34534/m.86753 type:complete len:237 (-) Transcript_34534:403-1113(-)